MYRNKRKWKAFLLLAGLVIITGLIAANRTPSELQKKQFDYDFKSVDDYLLKEGISNCYLKEAADISKLKYTPHSSEVSESDVDRYIEEELDQAAKFKEIKNRKKIRKNDFVSINYEGYSKNELKVNIHEMKVKVGAGYFNDKLENMLIGKKVGENFETDLTMEPDISVPQRMHFFVYIGAIYKCRVPELTDEYVKDNYGMENIQAYREHVKDELEKQRSEEARKEALESLFDSMIKDSRFHIDEQEIADLAADTVNGEKEQALSMSMEFTVYINSVLGMEEDEYYESSYNMSEKKIQKQIIVKQIAKDHNLGVTEQEIKDMDEPQADKADVIYQILENKAEEWLVSNT